MRQPVENHSNINIMFGAKSAEHTVQHTEYLDSVSVPHCLWALNGCIGISVLQGDKDATLDETNDYINYFQLQAKEALPERFKDRIGERGEVHVDWVQEELILSHPLVGCFVSHCGFVSMWESLVNTCQIILVPHAGDQFVNAKFMTRELKVVVDVDGRE
ncbi:hypothetical protein IFM89_004571 [Coptis chinensis]|uniref:Uncharacterized protein n=1 Tax=Coptis chinensis TaxID=261450 RepID=A0A835LGE8_9MAGN|nr:hypothetical protein IFM89_004571 [Coptis chinensis]